MPLKRCSENNQSGWKWGDSGKCYTGPDAKKKAIKQGIRIEGPKKFAAKAGKTIDKGDFEDMVLDPDSTYAELTAVASCVNLTAVERMAIEVTRQRLEADAAKMTRKSINDLPDSDFAYIEPGGKKDESGKTTPRSLRHLPIHDAAHVRNALARLPQTHIPEGAKKSALAKIKARAKKFGVEISDKKKD